MSDHCFVTFDINMKPKTQKKPQRKIHLLKKCDPELIQAERWKSLLMFSLPQSLSIRYGIASIVDKHVPSKLSKSRHDLSWITAEIKRKMRKRDRKSRMSSSFADWKAYRSYRNYVTKYIQQCHQGYVNNVIGESLIDNANLSGHIFFLVIYYVGGGTHGWVNVSGCCWCIWQAFSIQQRISQWCMPCSLAGHTYNIKYHGIKEHCNADGLSRIPLETTKSVTHLEIWAPSRQCVSQTKSIHTKSIST